MIECSGRYHKGRHLRQHLARLHDFELVMDQDKESVSIYITPYDKSFSWNITRIRAAPEQTKMKVYFFHLL